MSMSVAHYLERDATLPDMGRSGLGPRACTPADVEAVLACGDPVALAQMRGYARSYFATAGGMVLGSATAMVGALARRRVLAVVGIVGAGVATLVTIEARRRARQWESAIDTAITRATAHDRTNIST